MGELRVQHLSKTFDSMAGAAVDDVSFVAAEGDVISLLGPSGCGKTTTLRCIAGLEQPEDGEIWLDGRAITRGSHHLVPSERRGMGMVFQSYSIWPHMTVGENIAIGLRAKKMNRTDIAKKVGEVLALVRLPGLERRRATDLSGGQQQRVALARSLALEPKVLLFDEPLSNLDANLREQMRNELQELLSRLGITSIYVTHDQAEAFVISNRVCVMYGGKIVQSGPPQEIYQRPATRFVAEFIGSANILRGAIRAIDGDTVKVSLPDGQTILATGEGRLGQEVELCVRSEAVDVETTDPGDGGTPALVGKVSGRSYLGGSIEYRVAVGSESVRVGLRPTVQLEIGQKVWIRTVPASVLVLHPESTSERGETEAVAASAASIATAMPA
jgi:ABC-type Fe3+/spermidine/putrescine transport system ATPase subunit